MVGMHSVEQLELTSNHTRRLWRTHVRQMQLDQSPASDTLDDESAGVSGATPSSAPLYLLWYLMVELFIIVAVLNVHVGFRSFKMVTVVQGFRV